MAEFNYREIINYTEYRVGDLDDPNRQLIVDRIRARLADDGRAVIQNCVNKDGLQLLLDEARQRKHRSYYSPNKMCNIIPLREYQ